MLRRLIQRLRQRHGAATLLLLITLVGLLGILSVVIDTSRLMALKAEMQTAVDAGALAGALAMVDGAGDGARDVAIEYALKNYAEAESTTWLGFWAPRVRVPGPGRRPGRELR